MLSAAEILPAAPIVSGPMRIEPEWIDFNGHLNLAYYQVLFDRHLDAVFEDAGLGLSYLNLTKHSFFAAEVHLCYKREVKLTDEVTVSFRLLDFDEKRFHFFSEMHHASEGWLACTTENLGLHIDMTAKKVVPMLPQARAAFERFTAAHHHLPRPEAAGRRIALPSRSLS